MAKKCTHTTAIECRHTTVAERGLCYITGGPAHERGGYHPEDVRTARAALRLIARLRRQADAARQSAAPPKSETAES